MKLKQKLAAQYLGSLINEYGLSKREMETFIVGFEKAREMEADEFGASPTMKEAMLNLGEEEVEDQ